MSEIESEQQRVVNVSKRGQATIPKEIRDELGIEAPGRVKFVRTGDGEVVVKPIQSLTDLRGILSEKTDEDGRTATELLRDERERDRQKDREIVDRLHTETDSEPDGE